jgi:hypothetical protein
MRFPLKTLVLKPVMRDTLSLDFGYSGRDTEIVNTTVRYLKILQYFNVTAWHSFR